MLLHYDPLLRCPPGWRRLLAILLCSCVASAAAAFELGAVLSAINDADFRRHIGFLADDSLEGRDAGSSGGQAAAKYLVQQLQSHQLHPAGDGGDFRQTFQGNCQNLLGVLEGGDPKLKTQYVLVGAHYDHVGYGTTKTSRGPIGYVHNGADDNASGVAGVLELADACRALPEAPKRSVVFALWDGEEHGMRGAKHWLAHPTVPLDHVVVVLNLDMIGRLRNDTVNIFGTRTSPGLRRFISERNRGPGLLLEFTWELKPNSDHYAFFERGLPVLMLHTGVHPDFHRPSDDADKINYAGAEQVTRLAFAVLHDLANADAIRGFREQSRQETDASQKQFEQPLPPRPQRLGVAWRKVGARNGGLLVTSVVPDSPADRAGLQPGDRLVKLGAHDLFDEQQAFRTLLAAPSPATVLVERGDQPRKAVQVELVGEPLKLGISWREDPAEPGVVVLSQVVPGSAADAAGLVPGDRIYRVQGRDFHDHRSLTDLLTANVAQWELTVERHGQMRTVTLR